MEVLLDRVKRRTGSTRAGNDDEVEPVGEVAMGVAENLAQAALGAVSDDGVANLAGDNQAKAGGPGAGVAQGDHNKKTADALATA